MNRFLIGTSLGIAMLLANPAQAANESKTFPLPNRTYIHDVAPAPGGLVYWTAQSDGLLGIFNPATSANEFVKLGDGSAPHGIITGKDGKAWICDGGQNAIVSYDPKTKQVKAYPLPDTFGYTNLNTPTQDNDGNIWFTGQNGIHGRLIVATGKVDVWKSPEGRGSYGITTTPDGNVWFVSLASSYLAQVDKKTGEATVIKPPVANAGLRRVWSDSKGDLWMSEWNTGYIAQYSPATKQWHRFQLPGGERAHLYAVYVDKQDVVWVSNWADDKIWSFNPKTGEFNSVASKGSPDVRQINGTDGVVMLGESGNASLMTIKTGPQS